MIDPNQILNDPTFAQYLADLEAALQDTHLLGVDAGYQGIQAETNLTPAFSLNNPYVSNAVQDLAQKITSISDTTRDYVRDVIQAGIDNGSTLEEMADALQQSSAFDASRAMTIARTESRVAYNSGATAAMRSLGAEQVYVSDGEDFDEECASVDGTIQDIDWADDNPVQHPRCTRAFAPVPADEEVDLSDQAEPPEAD